MIKELRKHLDSDIEDGLYTEQEVRVINKLSEALSSAKLTNSDASFVDNCLKQSFTITKKQMAILFKIYNSHTSPMYGKHHRQDPEASDEDHAFYGDVFMVPNMY